MNARLYDPALGKFLSPDPYIQSPDYSQNFNRYSYCLNNPMRYTDPSGEFWHLVIGAVVGGTINWLANGAEFSWKGLGYFGIGALAGSLSAGIGVGVTTAISGASFWAGFVGSSQGVAAIVGAGYTSSFINGAAVGAAGGFASGFGTGFGNSLMQGKSFGNALVNGATDGMIGGASGALIGGVANGIDAAIDGRDFWHGGRITQDVSVSLPQYNQVGEMDCRYEVLRSNDKYFNGSTTDVALLKAKYPDVPISDLQMAKMYGSRGLGMSEIITKTGATKTDIAQEIINNLSQNKNVNFEMLLKKGLGHATGISRVRIYDNGRVLINLMNPSTSSSTITNFSNMIRLFSVFKF